MWLIIGTIGVICILIAFFLTNWDGYQNDQYILDEILNTAGAFLLVFYSIAGQVWPFVLLNIVWLFWSLYRVVKHLKKKPKQ